MKSTFVSKRVGIKRTEQETVYESTWSINAPTLSTDYKIEFKPQTIFTPTKDKSGNVERYMSESVISVSGVPTRDNFGNTTRKVVTLTQVAPTVGPRTMNQILGDLRTKREKRAAKRRKTASSTSTGLQLEFADILLW